MTTYVMHREVCLKHRKNRREISCGCELKFRVGSGVCSFFVVSGAGVTTRAALCGHRPRAGCLNANQAMPVQLRLTAPFSIQAHGGRQPAQQSLQNFAGSGQHRDAVPSFIRAQRRECADLIARGKPWGGRVTAYEAVALPLGDPAV